MRYLLSVGLALSAWLITCGVLPAAEPVVSPEAAKFFETRIRPVLAKNCYGCHGPDEQKSDLRLDSRAGMILGGSSGPAIDPGKPDESVLIVAVEKSDPFGYAMPPEGDLTANEIADLRQWIEQGAPWPGDAAESVVQKEKITDEDRQWWAFQPVLRPEVPPATDAWPLNPIDQFVAAKHAENGLTPAQPADARRLIRRMTFDMLGVPPSPEEIEAFVAAVELDRQAAVEQLADRLLADERYGERWAQHWLDLVRYAESDGYRQDAFRPLAWRYRDWVIESLNDDKPYDRFVAEQLAGDEIDPQDPDCVVATGFLRHGLYEYNQRDAETQQSEILNDLTDTTADVFLGLGMGCARCHDHKFDPVLQRDYFALQAFFAAVVWRDDVPAATPRQIAEYERQLDVWERATADIRAEMDTMATPVRAKAYEIAVTKFPDEVEAMVRKPEAEKTTYDRQITYLVDRQVEFEIARRVPGSFKEEQKTRWAELEERLAEFDTLKPKPLPSTMTVSDASAEAPVVRVPGKKNAPPVEPAFLTVLGHEPPTIIPPEVPTETTGRRTALAEWLTRPDHPLVPRVIANRVWQYHFGVGLVATPSDFGHLGEPASHPELLDWLARELVDGGWRLKPLHRLILTSRTYQQTALRETSPRAAMVDPDNRLLWRTNSRRLDSGQIRDALLAVSGELDTRAGGPSVDAKTPRRSVYVKFIRNTRDPLLESFDLPGGFSSTPTRNTTTTPTQSLMMINSDFMLDRAEAFARRLTPITDEGRRIERAFQLAFGRLPTDEEFAAAETFLARDASDAAAESPVLTMPFPRRKTEALLRSGSPDEPQLVAAHGTAWPTGNFTVEAFVRLESIYPNATVRTVASQWTGDQNSPGWSLGVTSTKSRYTPKNLILQLIGRDAQGKTSYEVVPSGIHIDLGRPYFVAASVRFDGETGPRVEFVARRLDGEHETQTAVVRTKIVAPLASPADVVLGGRHGSKTHRWAGLIDEVRVSGIALEPKQMLLSGGERPAVAHWTFEDKTDRLAGSGDRGPSLAIAGSNGSSAGERAAWVDLCHVLLNSNEFLYTD